MFKDKREQKKREFEQLSEQIAKLPRGPVSLELKRKRASMSGEIVNLRQQLIHEQIASPNPQHVARESFGLDEPQGEI